MTQHTPITKDPDIAFIKRQDPRLDAIDAREARLKYGNVATQERKRLLDLQKRERLAILRGRHG